MIRLIRIPLLLFGLLLAAASAAAETPTFREIARKNHDYVRTASIDGIPLYEVNSHHWALYAWILAAHDDPAEFAGPLTLVHVDAHDDLFESTLPPLDREETLLDPGRLLERTIEIDARPAPRGLDVERFITASFALLPFDRVVWLLPEFVEGKQNVKPGSYAVEWMRMDREGTARFSFFHPRVHLFGGTSDRYSNGVTFEERISRFETDGFTLKDSRPATIDVAPIDRPASLDTPYILDIDMDAFSCLDPTPRRGLPNHPAAGPEEIEKRVKQLVDRLRRSGSRPVAITMATSEGRTTGKWTGNFTPVGDIPLIRENLLRELTSWLEN